ncbi:flavodoxin family protein [Acidaminobacter sp. JC074]|uniref:flavodoxin family protein n=1 Tax=Acidaminobacter sp. JC074 TaxID=2530199 RepID=UPI001F0F0FDB|nr:flavodoxin family protein [Acidaminobacter sp. JC074]
MKIVILNGSPRPMGNTRTLLEEFRTGLEENTEALVDFIDLQDKTILPCEACNACGHTGRCKHKDSTNEIMPLITEADVIVFGTPVYWWGVTAQMKLMIDKFYTWHHVSYKVPNKKIGVIAVGGAAVGDEQYDLISNQFKCISNFLKWDIVFDKSYSAYNIGDIEKDQDAMEECRKLYNKI